ncbi:MAG: aldehyde dehydrogenase (NADP(+)), partial [Planctomycetota bacterium]
RGDDITSGFVASLRFGNGQMCTKPGVLVMTTSNARALGEKAATMLHEMDPLPLLNANVAKGFDRGTSRLEENEGVEILTPKPQPTATSALGPYHRSTRLYLLHANETTSWTELLHQETFGPVSLLVACDDEDAMLNVMSQFTGSLTATLHDQDGVDEAFQDAWLDIAMQFAGRIIHNGWPTGMEIGPATHHGGPFPASLDGRSTSVGYASLDRFVRPICFQNWRGFPHDHPSH